MVGMNKKKKKNDQKVFVSNVPAGQTNMTDYIDQNDTHMDQQKEQMLKQSIYVIQDFFTVISLT